jgi:hypothetical protein
MSTESLRFAGLTVRVEQFADELADQVGLSWNGRASVFERIRRLADSLDRLCHRISDPRQLTHRSREHLAWLRLVGDASVASDYVDALVRATAVFDAAAAPARWPRPIAVHFRPTKSVFRVRALAGRTLVLLPTPMIAVDDAAFRSLSDAMFGRRRDAHRESLHAILMSAAYQEVQAELEALGGLADDPRGRVHDLERSFQHVNATYFAERMPRPRLIWSRRITRGKFGHYNYSTDTVMVARTLDHADVPAFVVDHVVHHELLHKKHGLRWRDGRGYAHTAEFRAEERRFERYREADAFLRRLAQHRRVARMVS